MLVSHAPPPVAAAQLIQFAHARILIRAAGSLERRRIVRESADGVNQS
jgi:hypothetical protein